MPDLTLFQYDANAPLEFVVLSERAAGGAVIRDITYASPRGGKAPAYLITPSQNAPQAGVIFGHWGEGNREEFVDEAVILAKLGFASLCPEAPFLRPQEREPSLAEVPQLDAQWIVDVRRGVDLPLAEFPQLSGRLGYVGHSYAVTFGGAVAGIEHRVVAYVLMAGFPALSEWMRDATHPALVRERETTPQEEYQAYLAALEPLDARHYIGQAAPSDLLFQFARNDEFVSPESGERYFALASEPKRIAWYECGHALNGQARCDRATFLCERLGTAPPSADILNLLERAPTPTPLEEWDAHEPIT
jgi:cephalosporin-C deacetylase-like acetyl esterase